MRKFFESWPMAAVLWVWLTAGIIVEFNRFYPDLLFHPMGLLRAEEHQQLQPRNKLASWLNPFKKPSKGAFFIGLCCQITL